MTIETSFIMMVVFTTFVTLVSFSCKNFNTISNYIRKKQVEYSISYDINYNELKNEYDTIVKPKLSKENPSFKKVYNPEFVLRSLEASENISFINDTNSESNKNTN